MAVAAVLAAGVSGFVLVPAVFVGVTCFRPVAAPSAERRPPEAPPPVAGVQGYARAEAATYLTLPEWYIVHSTREYAAFIGHRPPSAFPYLGAVRQYWAYYAAVCRATRGIYPFDANTHLMLAVIGASFSAENAVKAAYETTVGRLTELVAAHHTDEDRFAASTATAYGAFMQTVPWYEFPFSSRVRALWRETGWWGPGPVRKWERKLALTAEYGVKAVYAGLIRVSTGAVYGQEDAVIHARLDGAPDRVFADPRVQRVHELAPGSWIVRLPRYEAFTSVVTGLVARGARFADIAGNDVIVLTALVPDGRRHPADAGEVVLDAPILTAPTTRRIAVAVPVRTLHAALPALERHGATLEHLYDY